MSHERVRYPDIAGYPDGLGFLDQGTAALEAQHPFDLSSPSAESDVELSVVDDVAASAYLALLGDRQIGVIHYAATADREITLRSTYVDPQVRGLGLATSFMAHVLDERRDAGDRIVVECPLIRNYLALHPEYRDIRVR